MSNDACFADMSRDFDGTLHWTMNDHDPDRFADIRQTEVFDIKQTYGITVQPKDLIFVGVDHYRQSELGTYHLSITEENDDETYTCANFVCMLHWDGCLYYENEEMEMVGPWLLLKDIRAETELSKASSILSAPMQDTSIKLIIEKVLEQEELHNVKINDDHLLPLDGPCPPWCEKAQEEN